MTQRRLIEEAFPLKKVSEDSRHEKNVRHGHISTLHIWPARRPPLGVDRRETGHIQARLKELKG